jgi:hypothetical protein
MCLNTNGLYKLNSHEIHFPSCDCTRAFRKAVNGIAAEGDKMNETILNLEKEEGTGLAACKTLAPTKR